MTTRIPFLHARKAFQRMDSWANNAAHMVAKGNMTMFTTYVDRIDSALSILKDLHVITEEEADRLINEYGEFWEEAADPDSKERWA